MFKEKQKLAAPVSKRRKKNSIRKFDLTKISSQFNSD
jgi:hypothetical protein